MDGPHVRVPFITRSTYIIGGRRPEATLQLNKSFFVTFVDCQREKKKRNTKTVYLCHLESCETVKRLYISTFIPLPATIVGKFCWWPYCKVVLMIGFSFRSL